ncbi:MAG: hypothetical protein M3N43_08375 [Actinomycetota bacterium]|nr:hypothetical protein [Actinomycetota bacterium]
MAHADVDRRRQSARIAARARFSRMSPAERARSMDPARAAQYEQLVDSIDPDRQLEPEELDRQVRERLRQRMTELSKLGAAARIAKAIERRAASAGDPA